MQKIGIILGLLVLGVLLFGCASMSNTDYANYTNDYTDDYNDNYSSDNTDYTDYTQNYTSDNAQNYTDDTPIETYKGGPIKIDGDKEFTAANGVVKGSGTSADPYIIEGWTINAINTSNESYGNYGIYIYDTSKYFVIRNCTVENVVGYGYGIYISDISNGRIENCMLTNDYQGISIGGSDNLIVSGNIIENCTKGSGITEGMYSNENIMISNNIITNCKGYGIYLFNYRNSYVINNTIRNNSGSGISVDASMNCSISNNIIQGNKYEGIDLSDSGWKGGDKNTVSNNDVSDNGAVGIDILGSYNTITNNTVNGNLGGIRLASAGLTYIVAGNNLISHNTVSNNKRNGLDLDFHCEGNTISYNTFASNNAANEYDPIEWGSKETVPRWYDMHIYDENNTFTDNTYGTIYIYGKN